MKDGINQDGKNPWMFCLSLSRRPLKELIPIFFIYQKYGIQSCSHTPAPMFMNHFFITVLIYQKTIFILEKKDSKRAFIIIGFSYLSINDYYDNSQKKKTKFKCAICKAQ